MRLRFLTAEAVSGLTAGIEQPGFDHDLWPLLHRDALWAYYSTLVRSQPGAVPDAAAFLAALEDALQPHAHSAGRRPRATTSGIDGCDSGYQSGMLNRSCARSSV